MPLCNGLPTGPCPSKRNDSTVRLGEGDLMLCKSCDTFRHQQWLESKKKATKPADKTDASSAASHSESKSEPVNASSTEAPSTSNRKLEDNRASSSRCGKIGGEPTAGIKPLADNKAKGKKVNSRKKEKKISDKNAVASDTDSDDDTQGAICASCLSTIDANCVKVTCTVCDGVYHPACTGIQEKVRRQFLGLLEQLGWVCEDCRIAARHTVQKLRSEITVLTETVADLQTQVIMLASYNRVQNHSSVTTPLTLPSDDTPQGTSVVAQVQLPTSEEEIHKALNDLNRRKRNVIITGLAENVDAASDAADFQQLCQDYLHCKPLVVNCFRLGQRIQGKPRRLLIRLRDEGTAAELLRSSRLLRESNNPLIAKAVYINPDLTPTAAKIAFEERQKRRQKKAARQQDGNSNDSTRITTQANNSEQLFRQNTNSGLTVNNNSSVDNLSLNLTASASTVTTQHPSPKDLLDNVPDNNTLPAFLASVRVTACDNNTTDDIVETTDSINDPTALNPCATPFQT